MEGPVEEFACPHCGVILQEEAAGNGFSLIGIKKTPPDDRLQSFLANDPVLEDYTKWQLGSVFSVLLGFFLASLVAAPLMKRFMAHNPFQPRHAGGLVWLILVGLLSLLLILGGVGVFFRVRKASRRYEAGILDRLNPDR